MKSTRPKDVCKATDLQYVSKVCFISVYFKVHKASSVQFGHFVQALMDWFNQKN